MGWIFIILILVVATGIYWNIIEKKKAEKALGKKMTLKEYFDYFDEQEKIRKQKAKEEKQASVNIEKKTHRIKQEDVVVEVIERAEPKNTSLDIPIEFIRMFERKEFDEARMFLQKIAYGMVDKSVPETEKRKFKAMMTYFADHDPLYHELIRKAYPIILSDEGILQSKIYPLLPDYNTETVRYVLYFAHELGDVIRVKKGRSYQLYTNKSKIENI